jgi:hypothetical protein
VEWGSALAAKFEVIFPPLEDRQQLLMIINRVPHEVVADTP